MNRLIGVVGWQPGEIMPHNQRGINGLPPMSSFGLPQQQEHPASDPMADFAAKELSASCRLLHVLIVTLFSRPLAALKLPSKRMVQFMNEWKHLLETVNCLEGNQQIPEGWHEGLEFNLNLITSGTHLDNFEHDAVQGLVNFIHIWSSRLNQVEKQNLRDDLKNQVRKILQHPYCLHFLSQAINLESWTENQRADFYVVNPDYPRFECYWTRAMFSKIQDLFLAYAFCSECCLKLDSDERIIAHMRKRHRQSIRGEYAEEAMDRLRKKERADTYNRCKALHDTYHPNCNDCNFDDQENVAD